ncbi:MAG: metallophosphoesterase family protein [Deltaproteobacteria bacterium]|nr:metallophosphoesterase family protein [Deltaproteobacteria bacterium]
MGRALPGLLFAAATLVAAMAHAEPAEVASVGTTDAALAWRSDDPAPTRVVVRKADGDGAWRTVEAETGLSRFHVLELDGLEPGTRYEYRLGGEEDGPGGVLTTRTPPPGDRVGVLWVLADIHLCAAEVQECPDGIRRLGAANGIYAAVLDEVRGRAAALPAELPQAVLILGDLAQHPVPETWRAVARSDTGDLPLCLIPGNHDGWDESWETRWAETTAALDDPACRYDGARGELELGPWRVVLLSTVVAGENRGELGDEQRGWLEGRLAAGPERPTLLALHHPWLPHPLAPLLGEASAYLCIRDAAPLEELFGRHPQVHAVLSGHLHVNWTGKRGTVVQHVFSATSQFPVGYHSLTLHEGGLVRRFHPLRAGAEESAASGAALKAWAADRGLPLPWAVTGVVAGDLAARADVQLLSDARTTPEASGPGSATSDAPERADGGQPVAAAASERIVLQESAAPDAPAGEAARPERTTGTRSGCRCALSAATGGRGALGTLFLLAVLARRRRSRPATCAEGPSPRRTA